MGYKTDICQPLYRSAYKESIVMIRSIKNHGFSLTEVLIAMVILTTGMVFIAGIFPAAIHLSTISVERVNASLAAEEAFANIRIYAQGRPETNSDDFCPSINNLTLNLNSLPNFSSSGKISDGSQSFPFIINNSDKVFPATEELDPNVFAYPSDDGRDINDKQYFWSAVLRFTKPIDPMTNSCPLVQVTVFVCRKVQSRLKYYDPNEFFSGTFNPNQTIDYPMAVPIEVVLVPGYQDRLQIQNNDMKTFIDNGYTIVDDETGRMYRVIERLKGINNDNTIVLDRNWDKWWFDKDGNWNSDDKDDDVLRDDIRVWVVPPPVNGNRNPCVAVYQRILKL